MSIFDGFKNKGQQCEPEKPYFLSLEEEITRCLSHQGKLFAIKVYRERTNVGLAEAKRAVEEIERKEKAPASLNSLYIDTDKLQAMIQARQKIHAIKYYREMTGVGLKEAKDAVDWLEQSLQNR